jgi:hypothetical protein
MSYQEKSLADYMADLTWRCDICRQVRPDAAISVRKIDIGPADSPGIVIRNVKYCNDNPTCAAGAANWIEPYRALR